MIIFGVIRAHPDPYDRPLPSSTSSSPSRRVPRGIRLSGGERRGFRPGMDKHPGSSNKGSSDPNRPTRWNPTSAPNSVQATGFFTRCPIMGAQDRSRPRAECTKGRQGHAHAVHDACIQRVQCRGWQRRKYSLGGRHCIRSGRRVEVRHADTLLVRASRGVYTGGERRRPHWPPVSRSRRARR